MASFFRTIFRKFCFIASLLCLGGLFGGSAFSPTSITPFTVLKGNIPEVRMDWVTPVRAKSSLHKDAALKRLGAIILAERALSISV